MCCVLCVAWQGVFVCICVLWRMVMYVCMCACNGIELFNFDARTALSLFVVVLELVSDVFVFYVANEISPRIQ